MCTGRQAGNQQPYRQTYFTDRISCQSPSINVQRSSLELLMQHFPSPLNPSKSFDHAAQGGGLSVLFLICLIYYAGQSGRVVTGSALTLLKLTSHHLLRPCCQVKSNSVSASFASLVAQHWRGVQVNLIILMSTTFTSLFLTVLMSDRVYPEIAKDKTHKFRLKFVMLRGGKCPL